VIKIIKGSDSLTVSKGAFKSLFASQGWVEENEADKSVLKADNKADDTFTTDTEDEDTGMEENSEYEDEDESDEESGTELSEIPLGEMTVKELKAFAGENGIDLTGFNNKDEIKAEIKKQLA